MRGSHDDPLRDRPAFPRSTPGDASDAALRASQLNGAMSTLLRSEPGGPGHASPVVIGMSPHKSSGCDDLVQGSPDLISVRDDPIAFILGHSAPLKIEYRGGPDLGHPEHFSEPNSRVVRGLARSNRLKDLRASLNRGDQSFENLQALTSRASFFVGHSR